MHVELELDDEEIRALILAHLAEKHHLTTTAMHFHFEPGNDTDRRPWLTAHIEATKQETPCAS